ncbi:helix-turn-helix domain-containing protein [Acetanaerobacterium elongatum]|uniref:Bacteriophage CI repressor helix-turn-helix domain-containing protein n=1 Tax=Acetanaerobacterium elongatum TaxID=258515 RepID=A0A1G9YY23_9FIRM|nr:helix-turn-helix domain-containing protein [Acetanaerobacterium elongatum]SDN14038.1 Bacteriophage CI repressor helix-turn-helix domain-containing protein [Acetanaerobacterium elongatum]
MDFIERIESLIALKSTTKKKMLEDLSLNKNSFATWRERGTIPSADVILKIANYFDVSTDYLLGNASKIESSTDDIKFALFGTTQIDDEVLDEVKRFAKYIKDKKENGDKDSL